MKAFLLLLALAVPAFADDEGPDAPRQSEPSPSPEPAPPPPLPPPPAAVAPPRMPAVVHLNEPARTGTWPFTIDLHVLVGAELHYQGEPIAFGFGGEGLWHGWIGIFASLFGSEGTPIVAPMNETLPDRISVPFGFAVRPLGPLASRHDGWAWRLLGGIGLQAGLSVEHLRVSSTDSTTAGMHLGLSVNVPLYGGPLEGGVSLRLGGRLMVTPEVVLHPDPSQPTLVIREGIVNGQLFVGLAYVP